MRLRFESLDVSTNRKVNANTWITQTHSRRHYTASRDRHKPLVNIISKPLHTLTAQLQRMQLRLQNYDLNLIYVKGTTMYFADTLS